MTYSPELGLIKSQGLLVTILTSSGDLYRGVLCGCTLESAGTSSITTKMTRRASSPNGSKTDVSSDQSCAFAGSGPDFAMTFDRNDIAELSLPSYDVPEASKPANSKSDRNSFCHCHHLIWCGCSQLDRVSYRRRNYASQRSDGEAVATLGARLRPGHGNVT